MPAEVPGGGEFQRQEPQLIMAIPLSDVPTVPNGTRITAPLELGATPRTWIVDSEVMREHDHVRVLVVECR
jgi:hypothetical protein